MRDKLYINNRASIDDIFYAPYYKNSKNLKLKKTILRFIKVTQL